ncbi:MAG: MBL fold metallo-hydrolase [Lachnospiraceae bacterium]|nr:MBL fold metallo-hydrolase [Lachnospiraceae bacterium]
MKTRAAWKSWLGLGLVAVLAALVSIRLFASAPVTASEYGTLKATVLKVGKADAIVVETPYQTMVIDAGEEDDGLELVSYLMNRGIRKVDVLVITHYDKDHVGGADTLVEKMPVDRVLVPDYESSSTEYADFVAALDAAGIVPEKLRESVSFTLGDAEVLVEPPLDYSILELAKAQTHQIPEVDNDLSLITTIEHGSNRLVFMGDAEKMRLREWLATSSAVSCDFVKLPHHGVFNSELENMTIQLLPRYVAVCDSAKNPAEAMTIDLLKKHNANVLQTKDGDITVISNGKLVEVSQKGQ